MRTALATGLVTYQIRLVLELIPPLELMSLITDRYIGIDDTRLRAIFLLERDLVDLARFVSCYLHKSCYCGACEKYNHWRFSNAQTLIGYYTISW